VFRLALALGYANPDIMLSEMPAHTLREWTIFYESDPWDSKYTHWRDDARMGIIAATIANAHKGKRGHTRKPQDFMNYIRERGAPQELTDEQRVARALRMARMFGWTVKRAGQ